MDLQPFCLGGSQVPGNPSQRQPAFSEIQATPAIYQPGI